MMIVHLQFDIEIARIAHCSRAAAQPANQHAPQAKPEARDDAFRAQHNGLREIYSASSTSLHWQP